MQISTVGNVTSIWISASRAKAKVANTSGLNGILDMTIRQTIMAAVNLSDVWHFTSRYACNQVSQKANNCKGTQSLILQYNHTYLHLSIPVQDHFPVINWFRWLKTLFHTSWHFLLGQSKSSSCYSFCLSGRINTPSYSCRALKRPCCLSLTSRLNYEEISITH